MSFIMFFYYVSYHFNHCFISKVLESVFVSSIVLLCSVHVLRYFKEKVFTGRAYWGDAGENNYVNGGDKDHLMKQIVIVRDSPILKLK